MKLLIPILCLLTLIPALVAGEKDVWYDASGKMVRVTPAEKEKETFVPDWKKRELARLDAQRRAANDRVVPRSRSSWEYSYPSYYGYGGRYYYSGYRGHFNRYHGGSRYRGHSPFRVRGSYYGNGWSVRLNF